jgi:hypothetical protein
MGTDKPCLYGGNYGRIEAMEVVKELCSKYDEGR